MNDMETNPGGSEAPIPTAAELEALVVGGDASSEGAEAEDAAIARSRAMENEAVSINRAQAEIGATQEDAAVENARRVLAEIPEVASSNVPPSAEVQNEARERRLSGIGATETGSVPLDPDTELQMTAAVDQVPARPETRYDRAEEGALNFVAGAVVRVVKTWRAITGRKKG